MPYVPGKAGSPSFWLLVDGFNLLAAKLQGLRYKRIIELQKTDGGGDGWPEFTPTGVQSAEVAQEGGFFHTETGNIHDAMAAKIPTDPTSTPRIVCLGFSGQQVGAPFVGAYGGYSHSYDVLGERGQLQRANAEYTISGEVEDGIVVHPLGIETADANTQATSCDNSVDTTQAPIPIVSSSVAGASVITTSVPHKLVSADTVVIAGHVGSTPTINGERVVTVLTPTTFSIPVNVTVGGTGGSFTRGKTQAGASAYLQVNSLALGGHTNAVVAMRHSPDNSVFADLATFAAVTTAPNAQRITVAGTVERYTAASVDFTGAGSPSMKFFAGLSRN